MLNFHEQRNLQSNTKYYIKLSQKETPEYTGEEVQYQTMSVILI